MALRRLSIPLLLAGLYLLASLLPPDTALRDVSSLGVLRACLPNQYPLLVTDDQELPGVDVELVRRIASLLNVRLLQNHISSMGQDFNPRNWRLTRAQCHVVAGGVVDTEETRSYLDVTRPYLETGWAVVMPVAGELHPGDSVGFYSTIAGLPRIELGRLLRGAGMTIVNIRTVEELVAGLDSGTFPAVITEALTGRSVAFDKGWDVFWVSKSLGVYPITLGTWKGDLTLKRAINRALTRLEREGQLLEITENYQLAPVTGYCDRCPW